MTAPPVHLEVRSRLPARVTRKPPLLFIHGGYCDAWCWEPYFLPWFAARGWPAYALSLRGHGSSSGAEALYVTGLDDYVADVEQVVSGLDAPPVLIGHSMGAAICERMMATRPVRGAALLAPVPPAGLMPVAARLAATHPDYMSHMIGFDPTKLSSELLQVLRPFYFSDGVDRAILRDALAHLNGESPRVLIDLTLRLHWALPKRRPSPAFVMGAIDDRIAVPDDVRATAAHHRVDATILPGMGHMLMLEPEWKLAAAALAEWLCTLD
ncbi:MAG: alpha/beta fold hydrolase [Burkholderiales bacterium]|nr:alpha/beta fold hydrolase [Burkholderiales bacterium]